MKDIIKTMLFSLVASLIVTAVIAAVGHGPVMQTEDATVQAATLHATYDNVACFETQDGNLWEVYVDAPETLDVYGEYSLVMVGDAVVQVAQR